MTDVQTIEGAGLMVVRSAIEPVLARDFAEECEGLVLSALTCRMTSEVASGRPVESFDCGNTARLAHLGLSAVKRVLDIIERPTGDLFVINKQGVGGQQAFHSDYGKQTPVVVIHPQEEGAFDYVTQAATKEEAEKCHQTLMLNEGDLVFQFKPWLLHRGRNTGQTTRLTAVVYRPAGWTSLNSRWRAQ